MFPFGYELHFGLLRSFGEMVANSGNKADITTTAPTNTPDLDIFSRLFTLSLSSLLPYVKVKGQTSS